MLYQSKESNYFCCDLEGDCPEARQLKRSISRGWFSPGEGKEA